MKWYELVQTLSSRIIFILPPLHWILSCSGIMCITRSPGSGVTVLDPLIENATTVHNILNCTFIFWYFLLVQNVISWLVYFTSCWPSVILRSEEWRNENILRVSREHVSSREVLKQMSADLLCTLWQTALYLMRVASSYTLMAYDLCYSELDRASIILTTGLCGLRGYVFPKDEKIGVFGKKVKKNKKCLKVFEKVLKYNCSIGKRYHSHPRLFVSNVKVPQKRVNRLRLKKYHLSF